MRDAEGGRWLRFTGLRRVLVARHVGEVLPALRRLDRAVAQEGLHAAGFVSYEAAPAFDAALVAQADHVFPFLWFGLFEKSKGIDLPPCILESEAGDPNWEPSITQDEYRNALARIKEFIGNGDTYQVNFTFRLRMPHCSDPWQLFLQLVAAQDPPYGAYIDTGEWAICSASPELFFRREGVYIESRPMKGTASRGLWFEQDLEQAAILRASAKERAENVMIVDMVRNDIAHVAEVGSVQTRILFAVERYPTVWQMTSTVCAETHAPLDRIFQALFPPASVTGAPKCRTTEIIASLESSPRRIYTGSIGYASPGRRAQFNVAIRTVLIDKKPQLAEYGVGGGIVWDSQPGNEYRECQVKARILHSPTPPFDLVETFLWQPEKGLFLLKRHLKRLRQSATYFGFKVDMPKVRRELARLAARLPGAPHRIRLLVSRNGAVAVEASALEPIRPGLSEIALASVPVDPSDPFLYHKTTNRRIYEEARRGCPDFSDVLLYNKRGEITESSIANVAVQIGGVFFTPPVRCGLLPGTYRAFLLERRRIQERPITIGEVLNSPAVYLFNSVRRVQRVRVVDTRADNTPA